MLDNNPGLDRTCQCPWHSCLSDSSSSSVRIQSSLASDHAYGFMPCHAALQSAFWLGFIAARLHKSSWRSALPEKADCAFPCILNQCLPSAYLYGISGTTRLKEIIQKENTGTMKIGHNTRVGTRSLGTMGSLPQQRALSKAMHFPICHKAHGGCWLSGELYCSLTFW